MPRLLFSHPLISTLCDPRDGSTPGRPVPHHLLEFARTHVHACPCICDAIQPSHLLGPLHVGPEDDPYFSVSLIHLELLNAHADHNRVWDKEVKKEPSGERNCLHGPPD